MRLVLHISAEDLSKMKMVYTSYLSSTHGDFSELEAKTVLLACLDKAYVQMEKRKEICK